MKRFMYASMGILALALAFHLGASAARSQGAQDPNSEIAGIGTGFLGYNRLTEVVTVSGDIYRKLGTDKWVHGGNIWQEIEEDGLE